MILGFHYWTNEKIDASDVLKKSGAPFLADCSEKTLYIPKQTIQMRFVSNVAARHFECAVTNFPEFKFVAV